MGASVFAKLLVLAGIVVVSGLSLLIELWLSVLLVVVRRSVTLSNWHEVWVSVLLESVVLIVGSIS